MFKRVMCSVLLVAVLSIFAAACEQPSERCVQTYHEETGRPITQPEPIVTSDK